MVSGHSGKFEYSQRNRYHKVWNGGKWFSLPFPTVESNRSSILDGKGKYTEKERDGGICCMSNNSVPGTLLGISFMYVYCP